jgi:hypothetical protein
MFRAWFPPLVVGFWNFRVFCPRCLIGTHGSSSLDLSLAVSRNSRGAAGRIVSPESLPRAASRSFPGQIVLHHLSTLHHELHML